MRPPAGPRRLIAIFNASATSSVRMCSASAQPTTFRDDRSMTVARYDHPSQVAM
jgi:hypothetical protein